MIDIPDPDGQPCHKEHPAMIFRGPNSAGTAYVVGISTTFDEAAGRLTIEMPWHPDGHTTTGLWKRCRMKCWWTCGINVRDIVKLIGQATPEVAERALDYIVAAVAEKESANP